MFDFPKVFWDFQNWTFINVQFSFSEKGFGVKYRIFARVGTLIPQNIYFESNLKTLRFTRSVWK
jgi:hypothetical protein